MKTLEKVESRMKQGDIAARAIQLWEKAGRHHHRDLEYWLEAEAELGTALPSGRVGGSGLEPDPENSSVACVEEVMAPPWKEACLGPCGWQKIDWPDPGPWQVPSVGDWQEKGEAEYPVREIERTAFHKIRRHPARRDFRREGTTGTIKETALRAAKQWRLQSSRACRPLRSDPDNRRASGAGKADSPGCCVRRLILACMKTSRRKGSVSVPLFSKHGR
jgi:hypothetical protein